MAQLCNYIFCNYATVPNYLRLLSGAEGVKQAQVDPIIEEIRICWKDIRIKTFEGGGEDRTELP